MQQRKDSFRFIGKQQQRKDSFRLSGIDKQSTPTFNTSVRATGPPNVTPFYTVYRRFRTKEKKSRVHLAGEQAGEQCNVGV